MIFTDDPVRDAEVWYREQTCEFDREEYENTMADMKREAEECLRYMDEEW